VGTPLIQVTAVSEDQTDNVYSALLPMIELGALHGEIEDTGLGRINLPGGGKIEPVTASAVSRLGQRITFSAQDQTESWLKSNGGRKLADNQRRNLAGMGGRWLSTPNAWDPTEESVAQYTAEHEHDGVYHDDVEPPESLSVRNKAERRRALRIVYGDAVTGNATRRKRARSSRGSTSTGSRPRSRPCSRDPAQAERWFLNRKEADRGQSLRRHPLEQARKEADRGPKRAFVTGIDGARFVDALAVVACSVESGYQWNVGIWERPEQRRTTTSIPSRDRRRDIEAFERFDVWRAYIDPQWIEDLGRHLAWGAGARSASFHG
jgi:hypothetical protein